VSENTTLICKLLQVFSLLLSTNQKAGRLPSVIRAILSPAGCWIFRGSRVKRWAVLRLHTLSTCPI